MRDGKTATLLLAITLNQHVVYTKKMITFKDDFHCDVEVTLCAYETPSGGSEITTEDQPPPLPEVPQPPEPDDVPEPVIRLEAEVNLAVRSRWHLPPLPTTLPENPTAKERWRYLLEVLKQKAAD